MMVARGFYNDNESVPPRAEHVGLHNAIDPVVRSCGWVRYALSEHGTHPDTADWKGMPGAVIALDLLDRAAELPTHPDPAVAERREQFIHERHAVMDWVLGVGVQHIEA